MEWLRHFLHYLSCSTMELNSHPADWQLPGVKLSCLLCSLFLSGCVFMMYLWKETFSTSLPLCHLGSLLSLLNPSIQFIGSLLKLWVLILASRSETAAKKRKEKRITWPCKCQKIYLQLGNRQNWLLSVLSVQSLATTPSNFGYFTTPLEQRLICKILSVEIK